MNSDWGSGSEGGTSGASQAAGRAQGSLLCEKFPLLPSSFGVPPQKLPASDNTTRDYFPKWLFVHLILLGTCLVLEFFTRAGAELMVCSC